MDNISILNENTEIDFDIREFNIEALDEKVIYNFITKKSNTLIGIYPSTLDSRLQYEPYFKIIGGPNKKYVCRVSMVECKYEYHNNKYDHRINAFLSNSELLILYQILYANIKLNIDGKDYDSIWKALFGFLSTLYPESKNEYEILSSKVIDYRKLKIDPNKAKSITYETKKGIFFK